MEKTHKSAENYLEAILMLSHSGKPVRSVDVANELEHSKPTISVAMKNLRASGYIVIDERGYITLTDSGKQIAQKIYDRHMLISDWLIFLGVDRETAVSDACEIEHDLSEKSFIALQKHIEEWKRSIYMQKSEREKE